MALIMYLIILAYKIGVKGKGRKNRKDLDVRNYRLGKSSFVFNLGPGAVYRSFQSRDRSNNGIN